VKRLFSFIRSTDPAKRVEAGSAVEALLSSYPVGLDDITKIVANENFGFISDRFGNTYMVTEISGHF
jgi:hypothetical protein